MARILLVEDNPLNRELTTDLLEFGGFEVHTAATGEEGLEMAARCQPDLVILDLSLPGMDGLSVARCLKADPELARIPVLVVSAHALKEDEQRAREVGCCGFLSKPFDSRIFVSKVRSFLELP